MAKTQSKTESSETKTFALISDEKLLAIYGALLRCSLLEQRATELFQHGKLDSDLHDSFGREATAAAATIDLEENDVLCVAPGDWLPAFVKGLSLEMLFRALAPAPLRLAGAAQIESAHKNILIGSAEEDTQKEVCQRASVFASAKKGDIVSVFLSRGPQSLAEWKGTLRECGTKKLPIVFIHYSGESEEATHPESKSFPGTHTTLHEGVPSMAVDALDPVAVYRVAYEAIVRARQLRGASLIECVFVPRSPAEGPSNSTDLTKTPSLISLMAMESYLRSKRIDPDKNAREIVLAFQRDLDSATRFLNS